MTHKLERRIAALETRIGPVSEPVTEIYLVSPTGEAPPVLYWRAPQCQAHTP